MQSELPASVRNESFSGLRTFLISAPRNAVLVFVSDSPELSGSDIELIPGGNGRIAASEVLKSLIHAGQQSGFSVSIQSILLTFYRLNWVDGSEAAATCLENGIQAASLLISDNAASSQLASYAEKLSLLLEDEELSEGTQYSIINTGTQVISIRESLWTMVLVAILIISLLVNCTFSFMFGKHRFENRTIFLKWWYVGPLLLIIVYLLTYSAQGIVVQLFDQYTLHPGTALLLKTALIIMLFLALCELRYIIPLAETDYLYAFFMTLAAALDVFVFTSSDMPLLLPFSLFYIVVLLARPVDRWWINLLIFTGMAFPLVFVLFKAAPYLRPDVFASFTEASPVLNFFIGSLLLPYLLMIVRIFIGLGIWDKQKGKKRIIIESSVIAGLIILSVVMSASLHNDSSPLSTDIGGIQYSEDRICISADAGLSNAMLSFELTLSKAEDAGLLRYDASVTSPAAVPLYATNLPFSFTSEAGNAVFTLDEYPSDPFVISGRAPHELPLTFTIHAWMKDGDDLLLETHSVTFTEESAGKNTSVKAIIK